jgi:ribonucleoside-diphosphate reductase subunit M1
MIANGGSVQFDWSEFGVSEEESVRLKSLFKTVWEIPMMRVIEHAATRQPYVDQAQSMNLYLKEPTLGKLSSMLVHSWKSNLKTGIYYLRVKAANETNKRLGISVSNKLDSSSTDCLGCSV